MNYYEILEVSQNASPGVIRAAYKSLIQRYHPDKNPGDSSIAERAALVVQAYEVLSDADKRSAYDIALREQRAVEPRARAYEARQVQVRPAAVDSTTAAADTRRFWYLCLLIALILSSGSLIILLTDAGSSVEPDLSGSRQPPKASRADPPGTKAAPPAAAAEPRPETAEAGAKEPPAREVQLLSRLFVNLRVPDKPLEDGVHVLFIPKLGVRVGTHDSESAIRHLQNRKELVVRNLTDKLAFAKYDDLIKIDGEQYLAKLILDSIGETTGTNRFEDFPASATESPARYGAVEILLPESFSVR